MLNRDRQFAASLIIKNALVAVKSGRHDEVVRLLTQVLDVFPRDSEIYYYRGVAYKYLQRYDEALTDFDSAIAFTAERPNSESYEQKGLVHQEAGRIVEARKDWEHAIRLNPEATIALLRLGSLALDEGEHQQAIDYFTRAISAEPTLANAFVHRARAYLAARKIDEAFVDLRGAHELVETGHDTSNTDRNT